MRLCGEELTFKFKPRERRRTNAFLIILHHSSFVCNGTSGNDRPIGDLSAGLERKSKFAPKIFGAPFCAGNPTIKEARKI